MAGSQVMKTSRLAAAAAMLVAGWVQAQPSVNVELSAADRAKLEQASKAAAALQSTLGDKPDQALQEAQRRLDGKKDPRPQPGASKPPNIAKLMELAGSRGVDPAKMADHYAKMPQGGGEDRNYQVIAFVTLGMPQEGLLRLARDVKRVGGVMVLRGTKHGLDPGMWQKSLEAMKPVADTGVELQINPPLFDQFKITRVPTIVVSPGGVSEKACGEAECKNPAFGKIIGDVTLAYAMDLLADRKDGVGKLARDLGDRLQ